MQSSLTVFVWGRPRTPARPARCFVRAQPPRGYQAIVFGPIDEEPIGYEPLAEPMMFAELGETERSPEGYSAFATRWGPLTEKQEGVLEEGREAESGYVAAERIQIWENETANFAETYNFWKKLSSEEGPDLDWIPPLLSNPRIEMSWPDTIRQIGTPRSKSELERAGWILFNKLVSQHLTRLKVAPRLFFNADTRQPALRIAPPNLIGAAWLQLAEAADQGRVVFRCQAPKCGQLRVKNPKCRSGRVYYCNDACKMRAQRQRSTARRLKGDGKTIPAIAKQLGVGPAEIRRML